MINPAPIVNLLQAGPLVAYTPHRALRSTRTAIKGRTLETSMDWEDDLVGRTVEPEGRLGLRVMAKFPQVVSLGESSGGIVTH